MGQVLAQVAQPNRLNDDFAVGSLYGFGGRPDGATRYTLDYFDADGNWLDGTSGESVNPGSATGYFGFDRSEGAVVNTLSLNAFHGEDDQATFTWTVFDAALESGHRTTYGTVGADIVLGGSGRDAVRTGTGEDTLDGGGGSDRLYGGGGNDFYYVTSGDKVFEAKGQGTDFVLASSSFKLQAGQSVDVMAAADYFTGYAAPIKLTGNESKQTIWGNSGANTLDGRGGADVVLGNQGDDVLRGGAGNDRLIGHFGEDTLEGGKGKDTMYGNTEADTFLYRSIADSTLASAGRDSIQDFNRFENDRIDLHRIDADRTTPGNQAFRFIGDDPFSGEAGELRAAAHGAKYTQVTGDVTGDGKADFAILLFGTFTLQDGDFVL